MKTPTLPPRAALLLCAAGVAVCAAAPAVFLRGADALYFARPQTVADPYTAPVPSGDDYYILRQLQAQQAARETTLREEASGQSGISSPRVYIGAASDLYSMNTNYEYRTTAADMLQSLADGGTLPQVWVDAALDWNDTETNEYDDYGSSYWLDTVYYSYDSVGVITFRRYGVYAGQLRTVFAITADSRTGQVLAVWLSAPAGSRPPALDESNLRAFVAQAGLTSLGDWTLRDDLNYTNALYSRNGEVLAAVDCKTYADAASYDPEARPYLSLGLYRCAEESLPVRLP